MREVLRCNRLSLVAGLSSVVKYVHCPAVHVSYYECVFQIKLEILGSFI